MDFGVVGLDGLVGSGSGSGSVSDIAFAPDPDTKQKWYGSSEFHKHQRSGTSEDHEFSSSSKLLKTDDFCTASKGGNSLLRSNTSFLSDGSQESHQMLSFSSPKSEALLLEQKNTTTQNASSVPYFYSTSGFNRNTGYNYGTGSLNSEGMHGGMRGPFSPSQWMELEQQALIYKYITANFPVPSNLLIPIRNRKPLDSSSAFSSFSSGFFRPNTLGWGSFQLGFSNNDPEPGRCRRTDGKKWRCSRDTVADQKYCERHLNRGRHRSRKPVEGQAGHSVAGTSTTTTTTSKQLSTSSSASMLVSGTGASTNSLAIANQQLKNLPPGSSQASGATQMNRMFLPEENGGEALNQVPSLCVLSSVVDPKSKLNPFFIQKQQINPYGDQSPSSQFGLISSDHFLLNPSQRTSLITQKSYGSSQDLTGRSIGSQHSLRQYINDWPKNHSDRSPISWPNLEMQPDRTQLSISIPMTSSDFTPSTSFPADEKLTMGLGVGNFLHEQNETSKQANWIPISWGSSMGGPLGEVLNHSSDSNVGEYNKNSSSGLNLMTEGRDNSPPVGSSPTGVLQRTAFGSLSNSSAGSSPRAETKKAGDGSSICNDLLGQLL